MKLRKAQEGFVKDMAVLGNATEAAARNYNVKNRDVAKTIGHENMTKPYLVEAVKAERLSIAERIPDDLVIEKHIAMLKKRETIRVYDEETKKTKLVRTKEIDAMAVGKGLELAYRVKNSLAPDRVLVLTKLLEQADNDDK